jgi:ATP adenylyltransferase
MAYIRAPKAGGCIFCRYPAEGPARHRPNLILCQNAHAFVILNRYPFAAGHVMVVPRRHVSDPSELPEPEYRAVFELVRDAGRALREAASAEGLNVGMNLGAAAGAGIAEHMHVHIVPRWRGDLNFMPTLANVKVMPEALDDTWSRLQPSFAQLSDGTASAGRPPEGADDTARRPPAREGRSRKSSRGNGR